ncbi:flagellar hook-associated protein FlgL [Microbacterium suaedae]|uniref:flagellar hook-associated protein FlgL n=1 Tax=Microbacterium suaedae TaxID=2067813 RepID=UPI000DA236A2|nr:flagellar hook-associated protein FlgL [Microbacterium suaedae]
MIGRITSSTMSQDTLRTLQKNLAERAELHDKATSQRAFRAPSDDPTAAATTLDLHSQQARASQHARNIGDAMAWTTTADSALSSSIDLLNRARDLVVQGANSGALSDTAREAIAAELDSIGEELLGQANTTIAGRHVFAGTSDAGTAFDSGTFAYNGQGTGGVNRRIDENQTVRVDVDGAAAFGTGADSVFALLDDIGTELRGGADVGSRLEDIDDRLHALVTAQGTAGSRQAQIERASTNNLSVSTDLEVRRAAVENVDSLEVLIELQSAELAYQSALQVTAKGLNTNLLEFLR